MPIYIQQLYEYIYKYITIRLGKYTYNDYTKNFYIYICTYLSIDLYIYLSITSIQELSSKR